MPTLTSRAAFRRSGPTGAEACWRSGTRTDISSTDLETYFVSLIKDDDWAVPVRTIAIRSEGELPQAIRTAVDIAAG